MSNNNEPTLYLTFFLLVILLSGCIQDRQTLPPMAALTASIATTEETTLLQTASPSATSTLLLPGSPSPQWTLTPTATLALSSSPTRTRPPKLSLEEQKQRLGWLLRTNGECSAPCVWGIVPNQTTSAEVRSLLLSLDQILDAPAAFPLTFRFYNMDGSLGHIGAGEFTADRGIIVGIRLLLGLNTQDMSRGDWAAFTPEGIFSAYGLPSEIRFGLRTIYDNQLSEQKARHFVGMLFFFASLKVIVEYGDEFVQRVDDYFHYCPTRLNFNPSVGVHIWMGKGAIYPPSHDTGIPLEDAAMISKQEFYQLLIENPGTACIDLKVDAFRDQ